MIPEFAILGHPNEGKSSVLSTLSEDDSVKISSEPGETTQCRVFPVVIDGKEVIKFIDTPGFQNPRKVLKKLELYDSKTTDLFKCFTDEHREQEEFMHDCELLQPLIAGAGVIYVADGSRPLRNIDLAEMEILRLTSKPRMAILNCKEDEKLHLEEWKNACLKHFNSIRIFDAHNATYNERIKLLEALKSIEQDWHSLLSHVVESFKGDWRIRNRKTAELISDFICSGVTHRCIVTLASKTQEDQQKEILFSQYQKDISQTEKQYLQQIRKLFKHNIFDYELPQQSILHQDLFSKNVLTVLGLSKKQLMIVGGAGGAAIAATLDLAAGGASLGFFTTMGGIIGATGAVYGRKNIVSKMKKLGFKADNMELHVGPNENGEFPFILLDRCLIYYSHIINWAHGRRDYERVETLPYYEGFTKHLPLQTIKKLNSIFKILRKQSHLSDILREELIQTIIECLETISRSGSHEKDSSFRKD